LLGRALRSRSPAPALAERVQGRDLPAEDPGRPGARLQEWLRQSQSYSKLPPASPDATPPGSEPARAVEARRAVEAVLARVNAKANPARVPEFNANINHVFLLGWLDSIHYTSSGLMDGIAAELRDRLCAGGLGAAEEIVVGKIFQLAPELSSPEAYECFFSRSPDLTVARATMLDAWRNSGLDPDSPDPAISEMTQNKEQVE
jgi:hypothetical protein